MIEKEASVNRDTWRWLLVKQSVDPNTADAPSTFVQLQELLPPSDLALRELETFSSYVDSTRMYTVAIADYPEEGKGTFFVSQINDDVSAATPKYESITLTYPDSSSPFPLNVAKLHISRVINGPNDVTLVLFTNGEVHQLDLDNKQFKKVTNLLSDADLLSVDFPHNSWSQVYDPASNILFSVITSDDNAYLVQTNMNTLTTSPKLKLILPHGINRENQFSPETFINMHMTPYGPAVFMESLNNIGFDEINVIDTVTGQLNYISANLMERSILLACADHLDCDELRNSVWVPDSNSFYFQGHLVNDDMSTTTYLFQLGDLEQARTGDLFTFFITPIFEIAYGYSGWQYVKFAGDAAEAVVAHNKKHDKMNLIKDAPPSRTPNGAIVAMQLRCQGYLCPQWAVDISTEQYIHQLGVEVETWMQEALPLAPTVERSQLMLSAYDPSTRIFSGVVCDYPVDGVDAYWQSVVNNNANATKPLSSYVLIPHPDTSAGNDGNMRLTRIFTFNNGNLLALFNDGSLHSINLASQSYSKVGAIYTESKYVMTDAHIIDNGLLKSVVQDLKGESYLLHTDLSTFSNVNTVMVQRIPTVLGEENPFALHVVQFDTPTLLIFYQGNLDMVNAIDETTGLQRAIVNNLEQINDPAIFMCNTATKDCDGWTTTAYDPVENKILFQAHYLEQNDLTTTSLYMLSFDKSLVDKLYYGFVNLVRYPMNFGFEGYQFVNFV